MKLLSCRRSKGHELLSVYVLLVLADTLLAFQVFLLSSVLVLFLPKYTDHSSRINFICDSNCFMPWLQIQMKPFPSGQTVASSGILVI